MNWLGAHVRFVIALRMGAVCCGGSATATKQAKKTKTGQSAPKNHEDVVAEEPRISGFLVPEVSDTPTHEREDVKDDFHSESAVKKDTGIEGIPDTDAESTQPHSPILRASRSGTVDHRTDATQQDVTASAHSSLALDGSRQRTQSSATSTDLPISEVGDGIRPGLDSEQPTRSENVFGPLAKERAPSTAQPLFSPPNLLRPLSLQKAQGTQNYRRAATEPWLARDAWGIPLANSPHPIGFQPMKRSQSARWHGQGL